MTPPPPDFPDDTLLITLLREAQAKPDAARAQALEDQLTARLQQLTSNNERKPDMHAQMVYTRRPSAQNVRTWGGLTTVALTLAACIVLVMIAFPPQTPPPSDHNIAAPIGVNQDSTTAPLATSVPTATPLPATVSFEANPLDGMATPTPLPGMGSFENNPLDEMATPTPAPFDESMYTSTPIPFTGIINPLIRVSTARFFYVGTQDVSAITVGTTIALYLPVVTVTDLPDASLSTLIAAHVVELVPVGTGFVVGVSGDGWVELQLTDALTANGSAWTAADSDALIGFTLIEE